MAWSVNNEFSVLVLARQGLDEHEFGRRRDLCLAGAGVRPAKQRVLSQLLGSCEILVLEDHKWNNRTNMI